MPEPLGTPVRDHRAVHEPVLEVEFFGLRTPRLEEIGCCGPDDGQLFHNRVSEGLPTIRDFMAITALSVLIVKKWAQIPTYFVIDSFGTTIPPGKGFAYAC